MSTTDLKQPPRHPRPSKNFKWISLLPILILLILTISLPSIYFIRRLNTLETSLNQFKDGAAHYTPIMQSLQDQIFRLSSELRNQERKTMSQRQDEVSMLKASTEHNQWQIDQLKINVEYYKTAYLQTSQEFADYKKRADEAINRLAADLDIQKDFTQSLSSLVTDVQKRSSATHELQLQTQDSNQEMLSKWQQVSDLQTRNEQSIDSIKKEMDLHKKSIQDLAKLGKQQTEILETFSTQSMPKVETKPVEDVKVEEKMKKKVVIEPMNPFDSSDEGETGDFVDKDEEAIVKWMKKASEKMQEELKKGSEQIGDVMGKVKVATEKMSEGFEEAGIRIGKEISTQAQRFVENGERVVSEYIKKIIEVSLQSAEGSSDFDEAFEL